MLRILGIGLISASIIWNIVILLFQNKDEEIMAKDIVLSFLTILLGLVFIIINFLS